MNKRTYRTVIEAAYRRSALRAISAFRTVSTDAAVVIAGMMPLGLVVEYAMEKWQQNWVNSYKGRWTYRLIPSISRMDQKETQSGELLPDTVVNRPWMI